MISGNSLIIKVNQILGNLFRKSMEDVVVALGNQTGRRYHRKIFAAMQEGDQQKTTEMVREHIQNTIESIKESKLKRIDGYLAWSGDAGCQEGLGGRLQRA